MCIQNWINAWTVIYDIVSKKLIFTWQFRLSIVQWIGEVLLLRLSFCNLTQHFKAAWCIFLAISITVLNNFLHTPIIFEGYNLSTINTRELVSFQCWKYSKLLRIISLLEHIKMHLVRKENRLDLLPQWLSLFNLYIMHMHRLYTKQTSEILVNKMHTCSILICKNMTLFISLSKS